MSNSPTAVSPTSPTSPTLPTPPTPPTLPDNENEYENEYENNFEDTNIAVIKVSNQMITRRFTMPTERPTWLELELKVREIFSIPSSVAPGLTYVDEEEDVIALSSQAELDDYYKQIKKIDHDSPKTSYKFNLVIFTPIKDDDNNEKDDYEEEEVRSVCPTQ